MPIPDFVLNLRSKIGHDPLWLSGSTAVTFDGDRILLIRRADDGNWAPVTGVIDPGEEPADTAVRESMEEAGVVVEAIRLCSISVMHPVVYPNGDHAQYIDHTFRCRYISGEARVNDDETTDVRWFPADDLPEMPDYFLERIESAREPDGPAKFKGGRPV